MKTHTQGINAAVSALAATKAGTRSAAENAVISYMIERGWPVEALIRGDRVEVEAS